MEGRLPTLKDYRGQTIDVTCGPCGRSAIFERADLVKKYGAGIRFVDLRRRLALGCERMTHPNGDTCGTRFPCLLSTALRIYNRNR